MKTISRAEYISLTQSQNNILTIDIRKTDDFIHGFIPESIHVPSQRLSKYFPYVAHNFQDVVMVSYRDISPEEKDIINQLNFSGNLYLLDEGYEGWQAHQKEMDMIIDIEADEVAMDYKFDENILLIDVRSESDFIEGHIHGAVNFPVKNIIDIIYLADIDTDKNLYIHCGGGASSVLMASYMKRQGVHNCYVILEGYNALVKTGKFDIVITKPEEEKEKEESEDQPSED